MFTEVELPVNILTMLAQELKSSSNNQIVKNGIKPPYANANHIDQQTWIWILWQSNIVTFFNTIINTRI